LASWHIGGRTRSRQVACERPPGRARTEGQTEMKNANSVAVISAARDNTPVDNTAGSTLIGVRLQPKLLEALDKWNAGDLSRPKADERAARPTARHFLEEFKNCGRTDEGTIPLPASRPFGSDHSGARRLLNRLARAIALHDRKRDPVDSGYR
jgi:hypothetical protein